MQYLGIDVCVSEVCLRLFCTFELKDRININPRHVEQVLSRVHHRHDLVFKICTLLWRSLKQFLCT